MTEKTFDQYVFEWIRREIGAETCSDKICAFYVQNFVFKNNEYLKRIMRNYNLPSDFLKLNKKIMNLVAEK